MAMSDCQPGTRSVRLNPNGWEHVGFVPESVSSATLCSDLPAPSLAKKKGEKGTDAITAVQTASSANRHGRAPGGTCRKPIRNTWARSNAEKSVRHLRQYWHSPKRWIPRRHNLQIISCPGGDPALVRFKREWARYMVTLARNLHLS